MSRLRLRGGIDAAGPPPDVTWGPRPSAQAIRDNAKPGTVSNPGGGVAFYANSNIAALLAANPAGTTFVASTANGATFTNFRDVFYAGKAPKFWFPGPPGTFIIDGGYAANRGLLVLDVVTGGEPLEVHGGTWKRYGTGTGANWHRPISLRGDSTISDCIFQDNYGMGVNVAGAGATITIQRCSFLDNGYYALSGNSTSGTSYNLTMEYCYAARNNYASPGDLNDASTTKFGRTNPGVFRYNHFENNYGNGLWYDGYNRNGLAHDNVIENNNGYGLFYEISRGGFIFEYNYVAYNGNPNNINYAYNGVQVVVSNSPCDGTGGEGATNIRSEIRYNDVYTTNYQSPVVLYNHSNHPDVERTRNWYIHHNRLTSYGATGRSRTGIWDASTLGSAKEGDIGTSPGLPGACLFDSNTYRVADSPATSAYWNHCTSNQSPPALTWAQFKARGHEANESSVTQL